MSDFFDKTKDTACGIYNSTKLRAKIVAEEAKIRELYYRLGREYFYDLENDVDDISGLEELVDDIKSRLANIASMKKKISAADHMKLCDACGAVNPEKNFYCGKCGTKL